MMTRLVQKRKGYLAIGAIGTLSSAGYLGMSFQLPLGQLEQPGAAVFPLIAGALLLLGSLATVWEGWRMESDVVVELPAGTNALRLLGLVGLLLAYFVTLPWVGQLLGSILFCIGLIRLLASLAWPRIIAYAVLMSCTLYALFVHTLKVPMPKGLLSF